MPPLPLFMHTNRATQPPPRSSHFDLRTGWWSDRHNISFRKGKGTHGPWGAGGVAFLFKYDWMLETAGALPVSGPHDAVPVTDPWMLVDTDTVFQCGAAELRRRFAHFGTPLVYGAERNCYPSCKGRARSVYPPVPTQLRYPNTGGIMGTRAGFELVHKLLHTKMPQFPCCHELSDQGEVSSSTCLVEEQGCIQRLIQSGSLRLGVDVALDSNASLFLNLHQLPSSLLVAEQDGTLRYGAGGHKPCVLHTNSNAGKAMYPQIAQRASAAWVVQPLAKPST